MPQHNQVEILLEPLYLKEGYQPHYNSAGKLRYKSNGLYYHGVRPDEEEAKTKGCGSFWGYGRNNAPGCPPTIHRKKWDFHIQEEDPRFDGNKCNNFCNNCSLVKENPKSEKYRCMGHKEEEVCPSNVPKFITRPLKNGTSRTCLAKKKKSVTKWENMGGYYCEKMNIYVQPYNVESKDVPEKDDGSQLTTGQILEKAPRHFNNNVEESPLGEKENNDSNFADSDTDSPVSSCDNNATDSDSNYIPSEDCSPKSVSGKEENRAGPKSLPPNCSYKRKTFTDREKINMMHRQQYKCGGNCDQLLDIECIDIDHIVEKQDLGYFDNNHYNLVALCCNCHRKKTNRMIKKRTKLKKAKVNAESEAKKGIEVRKAKWYEKNQFAIEFPVPSYLDISDQL